MHSGQVIGAAAPIDWQHTVNRLLAPNAFVLMIQDHPIESG